MQGGGVKGKHDHHPVNIREYEQDEGEPEKLMWGIKSTPRSFSLRRSMDLRNLTDYHVMLLHVTVTHNVIMWGAPSITLPLSLPSIRISMWCSLLAPMLADPGPR